jgi:hypothetical protein
VPIGFPRKTLEELRAGLPTRTLSSAEGKAAIGRRTNALAEDDLVQFERAQVLRHLEEIVSRRIGSPVSEEDAKDEAARSDAKDESDDSVLFLGASKGRSGHDRAEARRFRREEAERGQQVVDGIGALVKLANADHAEAQARHEETMAIARAGARWGKIAALTGLVGIPTTVILGVLAIVLAN